MVKSCRQSDVTELRCDEGVKSFIFQNKLIKQADQN